MVEQDTLEAYCRKKEEESDTFKKYLQENPNDDKAWYDFGIFTQDYMRREDAEAYFKKAIEINPNNGLYWFELAELLWRLKRKEEAAEAYKKGSNIEPYNLKQSFQHIRQSSDPLVEISSSDIASMSYQDEKEYYWKMVSDHPTDGERWRKLGKFYVGSYDGRGDQYCLEKAVELSPDNGKYWFELAHIYKGDEESKSKSEETYKKGIEKDPKMGLYYDGCNFLEEKEFSLAADAFTKYLAIDPDFYDAINNLGCSLTCLGDLEEALNCFKKIDNFINIALVLVKLHRFTEAAEIFPKAMEQYPLSRSIRYSYVNLLWFLGRYEEAKMVDKAAPRLPAMTYMLIPAMRKKCLSEEYKAGIIGSNQQLQICIKRPFSSPL